MERAVSMVRDVSIMSHSFSRGDLGIELRNENTASKSCRRGECFIRCLKVVHRVSQSLIELVWNNLTLLSPSIYLKTKILFNNNQSSSPGIYHECSYCHWVFKNFTAGRDTAPLLASPPVVQQSSVLPTGIVQSFRSCRSFNWSPLWTPQVYGPGS